MTQRLFRQRELESCEIVTPESYLQDIRELTPKLPLASRKTYTPQIHQINMARGTAISFGLLQEPAISCAKTFMSAYSESPKHAHEMREYIIVFKGRLVVKVGNKAHGLNEGDAVRIPPQVVHSTKTEDLDCWFLAITIPQSADWPDAPEVPDARPQ